MMLNIIHIEEILGLIGGGLFFSSWILQSWETKKAGEAIVSFNFFLLRFIASSLLFLEAMRVKSPVLSLVQLGTLVLIVYNMYMIQHKRKT